jgi:branched-chain amino acid transport system permease protein
MLIRAGASNRRMIAALGVNIELLFSLVFGLGAVFAALAGLMAAPLTSVKIGMGDDILILTFVIIVIGGIGSIKGAFVAAMLVGQIDIIGRAFLPDMLKTFLSPSAAASAAPSISQVLVYVLMAGVLIWRPTGLFGQKN